MESGTTGQGRTGTGHTSTGHSSTGHPEAAEVAAGLERLLALIRWLSPPGLSLTTAATLTTLERSGPCRLTALAANESVTQPAMTQLVGRLEEAGLAVRGADPADGRAVQVQITDAGRELVKRRRAARAERLSALLARLSQADQEALAAALPAINALASAERDDVPVTGGQD
jgi:DNA-binding MarR family transcriptional regulator